MFIAYCKFEATASGWLAYFSIKTGNQETASLASPKVTTSTYQHI